MAFQKQETTIYIASQGAKGSAATVAGSDAVEITADSTLVKPMGNHVERNVLRPGTRLGIKKLTVGQWGEGDIATELHPGSAAGTAPEFGPLLKSILGTETVDAGVSVTYDISTTGDSTWLTIEQYEDGAKYQAVDARCRSWAVQVAVNEIIKQTFGCKSLTCNYSDATDGLTQTIDGLDPFVATSMTFTVGGSTLNCKSVDFTVDNPKMDAYINSAGLGDLPADSTLNVSGTFAPEMVDVSPMTSFFNGTLADMVIAATSGGQTCTITLSDVQYDKPDTNEEEGDLIWSIPFTVTGGVEVVFS